MSVGPVAWWLPVKPDIKRGRLPLIATQRTLLEASKEAHVTKSSERWMPLVSKPKNNILYESGVYSEPTSSI